ncbi:hypothetical protein OG302_00725 [Streptomyces sp. NBC_01283]|uniref:hypothetical protein n=1 Tax=Streptomyces sp. NBC_01283 TaxID=2903812 RepID=UPI00352F14D1|nr:hypothetical protein OG302_00725 [Streptomyces sp. NBC_01283]
MAADAGDSALSVVIAPALTVIVGALLSALGLWIKEWRLRRNDEARRRQDLAAAHAHLSYITEWFSTRESLAPEADLGTMRVWAAALLDRQMRSLHNNITAEPAPRRPVSLWALVRSVLLLYPLRSVGGTLVRLAFWLLFVLTCSMLPALFFSSQDGWGWATASGRLSSSQP